MAYFTKIIAIVAALGASTVVEAGDKKCRALVLSGGGTNGAWEAGVTWGLTHYAKNVTDYEWEVHTGVSAGSINTIGLVGWDVNQATNSTQYLSDMWASVYNSDVYKNWDGSTGFVNSCLTNISCFDTSPALNWLRGQLSRFTEVKRRFSVSAVDVLNGEYITFD